MRFTITFSAIAILGFAVVTNASVNVEVIPAQDGCKGAVIYNNSNHLLEVGINYIYEGQGGAYYAGSYSPYPVLPRSNHTVPRFFPFNVNCSKPYSFRIVNHTIVDVTAERERTAEAQRRAAEAQRRQDEILADGQRKFFEEREREAKRRQNEARAKEQQRIDERKRKEADQAARQRYADEQRRLAEERHQEAERERFDKVQDALIREGGGRCIAGRDGLAECEKALARVREENDKKKYADFKARKEREAEERRQAEHAAQVRAWDEERQRRHSMGCAEAEAEMRQAPEKIRQLQAQGTQKGAHGAAMLKEWLAALQARCGAPQAPMPAPQYQAAPMQTQSYQPPVAQTAPANDPCEHTRKAYEKDPANLAKAYLLKRCVKKNRQAVQVQ